MTSKPTHELKVFTGERKTPTMTRQGSRAEMMAAAVHFCQAGFRLSEDDDTSKFYPASVINYVDVRKIES